MDRTQGKTSLICVAMVYYSRTPFLDIAMQFANPDPDEILRLLNKVHSIAVVGLSPNEARPSFHVAQGLQGLGYRIIPVRPRHGGAEPSGAGVAASHLLPQSAGFASNVSEVRPRHGGAEPSGAGVAASHLLPQSAGFASNVS
ncbi:MAG: CoA-binding protein, partial [Gallionella sp.]